MQQRSTELIERINGDPDFQKLVERRTRLSIILTALVMTAYFGFILLIALAPHTVGKSLNGGVTTIGIPLGIGVIVVAFILTAVYVQRANSEFDELTGRIRERLNESASHE